MVARPRLSYRLSCSACEGTSCSCDLGRGSRKARNLANAENEVSYSFTDIGVDDAKAVVNGPRYPSTEPNAAATGCSGDG